MIRQALSVAAGVARQTGTLLAGNICNTNIFDPADPDSHKAVRQMFEEQVQWAVDAGVDYIVGETPSSSKSSNVTESSLRPTSGMLR